MKMQHDDKILPTHTDNFPGDARNYRSMQLLPLLPMKSVFHFVVKSEKRSHWVSLLAVECVCVLKAHCAFVFIKPKEDSRKFREKFKD